MQHLYSLENLHLKSTWVTIGAFDGVHRGHQALIGPLIEAAHQAGREVVVLTFFPHPVVVLRGLRGPFYLNSPEERAELLGKLGADYVVTLNFTRQVAALSAREFVELASEHLGLERLWVGDDFALGRNRQGDIPTLKQLGQEYGFQVEVMSKIDLKDEIVSSSRIRSLISQGDVSEAAKLLGYWYGMSGPVIHGDGRGKSLGIPTANLDYSPERILPAFGIYATWTLIDGICYPSVTNVGIRPTFKNINNNVQIEAYLMDFDRDIYDKIIRLEFVEYLRQEERFDNIQALIDQMHADIRKAQEVLQNATQSTGLST
ncbi:MAG: bifunctional riboflavin kinase/FAD synthetase [Anaerolineaceae bacterium]|nr:bifunctional riboflavin kinase/FAD synthetase [Anaerolineaceae bacterium]